MKRSIKYNMRPSELKFKSESLIDYAQDGETQSSEHDLETNQEERKANGSDYPVGDFILGCSSNIFIGFFLFLLLIGILSAIFNQESAALSLFFFFIIEAVVIFFIFKKNKFIAMGFLTTFLLVLLISGSCAL